jgi:uncharacterized protein YbjT (DUF2867 family)
MMFGYFESKLAAEQVLSDSGMAWTTLRSTQFHDLLLKVAQQLERLPVVAAPAGFRVQPIDAGEAAGRLVELALGPPVGLVPAIAGPTVCDVATLLRGYLRTRRKYRPVLPVWLPGKAAQAFRSGANLAPERGSWSSNLGGFPRRTRSVHGVSRRREHFLPFVMTSFGTDRAENRTAGLAWL